MFGRLASCDVLLEHLSISRQHAQMTTDGAGNLFITDLGSGAAVCGALCTRQALNIMNTLHEADNWRGPSCGPVEGSRLGLIAC